MKAIVRIRQTIKKIKKEIELYRKYQKQFKDSPYELWKYELLIHELSKVRMWLDEEYAGYKTDSLEESLEEKISLKQTTL